MTNFREETLANGLHVAFRDESNRYFGDYHRVCVIATLSFSIADLPTDGPGDEALRAEAGRVFGETLTVTRRLERMAVPTLKVEATRDALAGDFMAHAAGYLARPATLRSLLQAELSTRRSPRRYD